MSTLYHNFKFLLNHLLDLIVSLMSYLSLLDQNNDKKQTVILQRYGLWSGAEAVPKKEPPPSSIEVC